MIKVLAFIKKLPRLTKQEFMDYYEANHAPLISRLLPMIDQYRRNYILESVFTEMEQEYSAVTELQFISENEYKKFLELTADPEIVDQIRRDEANFLETSETRMMIVKEVAT